MIYELWDTEGRNITGSYESEDDALRTVLEASVRHGAGYLESVAMVSDDGRGHVKTLATGGELLIRANTAAARSQPVFG